MTDHTTAAQAAMQEAVLTDDQVEALAKKHIAPHADRLDKLLPHRVPYQQTEQFRRVKALIVDVLSKLRAPVADERAASFNPEDCNKEVYDRGTYVGLFDIPKHVANALCEGISAATGARVDWHYFGGRVRVMALPATVQEADRFRTAYMEWQEKTDFIQERIASGDLPVKYLGWHRADVMRDLIDAALASAPVASAEVMDALNWVDDFIARCNRDDRGSCESVNVLRRALASAPVAEPETMEEIHRQERERSPWKLPKDPTLPDCAPVTDESPMAKMADALREKARQERQAYQNRREVDRVASAPVAGEAQAWMHENDPTRVISAKQKAQAERDGGAYASSLRPYTIPLSRYAAPQASEAVPGCLLAAEHVGMTVDYTGLLGQARSALKRGENAPAMAEMLRQLAVHLTELGRRWYAGDATVVDEFLQHYCIESDARAALSAQPAAIRNPLIAEPSGNPGELSAQPGAQKGGSDEA